MPETACGIRIGPMTAEDLPRIRELARQLGYPDTLEALAARFGRIMAHSDHELVTAHTSAGEIIGWLHLNLLLPLEVPAAAQISGIVVDETWRGKGVGRLLVAYAEIWAKARGLDRLTLRSRHDRAEAHAFYRGLGFEATKTSVVFEKALEQLDRK